MGTGRWWFRPTCTALRRGNSWRKWRKLWARRCWPGAGTDKPLEIVRGAIHEAKLSASDVILVDTAGRLHIDDELMNELGMLKKELQPSEILFIADAMIGQDAVRSAGEFHKRLGLTGVILTKLDGDARGGAALSIGKVTGAPVKFVGLGEKYDALEGFYPERIVSRVMGMGDMMSLIERAEQTVDHKSRGGAGTQAAARRVHAGGFSRSAEADSEDGTAGAVGGHAAEGRAAAEFAERRAGGRGEA